MRFSLAAASLALVCLVWAAYLCFPVNYLYRYQAQFLGYSVPVFYFFILSPILLALLGCLISAGSWNRWSLLWWSPALACIPGVLMAQDAAWSLRQWLSFVLRGPAIGWIFFQLPIPTTTLRRAIFVIYGVVLVAALFGIFEVAGKPPYRYIFYTADPVNSEIKSVRNPFYRANLSAGIGSSTSARFGTQGNKIPYTACLVAFIPLGIHLIRWTHWKRSWMHVLGLAALCYVPVAFLARTAWIGMLVGISAYLFLARYRILRFIFPLILILFFFWFGKNQTTLKMSLSDPNIQHRLKSWSVLSVLRSRPLFGVGYGHYPSVYQAYYRGPAVELPTPDNQYLRWFVETGVLGLSTLCFFLVFLFAAVFRSVQEIGIEDDYYNALLAGWCGVGSTFFFFDGFYWGACNMTFWALLGVMASYLKEPHRDRGVLQFENEPRGLARICGTSLNIVNTLF